MRNWQTEDPQYAAGNDAASASGRTNRWQYRAAAGKAESQNLLKMCIRDRYLTVDQHTVSSSWLCISDQAWNSLSAEYQSVIAAGGQIWQYYLRAPKELAATEALTDMSEHGVEVYVMPASERERLKDACQGVVVEYMRDTIGDEWIDMLLSATEAATKNILGN